MCISHVHPHACKHEDMLWHAYGGQRTILQAWFAPSAMMWDEGMELRFSVIVPPYQLIGLAGDTV